jgi:hypothetical protein
MVSTTSAQATSSGVTWWLRKDADETPRSSSWRAIGGSIGRRGWPQVPALRNSRPGLAGETSDEAYTSANAERQMFAVHTKSTRSGESISDNSR